MTTILSSFRTQLHYYVFFIVLAAGLVYAQGGFQRNLWSLRYLWHDPTAPNAALDTQALVANNQRAYLWQAQDAFRAGNLGLAEEKLSPLITANEFKAPFLRRDTMRLYGAILAETGRVDQALPLWRDIQDIDSLQGFAAKTANNDDFTTALQAYEIAYDLDRQAGAHQLANFLWSKLKEPGEAETILREAVAEFPYSGEQRTWLHLLGRIYRGEERWADAISIYEILTQLDSSDSYAFLQMGNVMSERGDGVAQIMAQYQAAIAADPNRAESYHAIGQLLARNGDFGTADQYYQQAVTRNPKSLGYMLTYAANARDMGDPQLTIDRYRQLQEAFSDQHRAHAEAAWVFHGAGLTNDAKLSIDTALRLAGSNAPNWYADRAEKIYGE